MDCLKIAFWNANGLAQHTLEVKSFLKTNQVEIFLISETHFTEKSHFYIPQYKFYHAMHPDETAHGGSAILIKNTIKHHKGILFRSNELQATNIIVEDWHGPVSISSVYSPQKHNIKKDKYKEFFKTLGHRFLACGDYNAKHTVWGSRLITTKGRQLYSAIKDLSLNVTFPDSPTYWPTDLNKIPDLIDFCVSKGMPPKFQKCESCFDLSSDHSPVILHIKHNFSNIEQPCKLHTKKTDWNRYRFLISENLVTQLPLKTYENISDAVEHLVNTIQQSAWNSTPQYSYANIPKCSIEIRNKISEKRKARKRWQTTKSPGDKTILNKLTAELKMLLKDERDKKFESDMQNVDCTKSTDFSLWKITNKVKQQHKVNHPVRKTDNN